MDVAIELGVACGGWCPGGRWSEDGPIDARYRLQETPSEDPAQRTRWNVRDSDATLILAAQPLSGGTALTRRIADELNKPCLVVDPRSPPDAAAIMQWLTESRVATLNIAGPRETGSPGIYDAAKQWLREVLKAGKGNK